MYVNKFVACIMVDDEVVREVRKDNADLIYLPFGTDYQIRLKNLDYRRAVVSISIDGDDVLDGSRLVVEGNSTTDLKGFLDSKTNKARNAFRFIEKTERVSEHRGDRVDDGLVRIEVQFEEDLPVALIEQTIKWPICPPHQPYYPHQDWYPYQPMIFWYGGGLSSGNDGICRGQSFSYSGDCEFTNIQCNVNQQSTMDANVDADDEVDLTNLDDPGSTTNTVNADGITVTGNVVGQVFSTTHVRRLTADKVVIVFKLQGKKSDSRPVMKPLLVKSKIECHTCGEKCKSGVKYCGECGTCLL